MVLRRVNVCDFYDTCLHRFIFLGQDNTGRYSVTKGQIATFIQFVRLVFRNIDSHLYQMKTLGTDTVSKKEILTSAAAMGWRKELMEDILTYGCCLSFTLTVSSASRFEKLEDGIPWRNVVVCIATIPSEVQSLVGNRHSSSFVRICWSLLGLYLSSLARNLGWEQNSGCLWRKLWSVCVFSFC